MPLGIRVTVIPVTPFVQNCSLLSCEETGKAAVVDPGGDVDRILGVAAEAGVEIEKVLLTHGHIDHAGDTAELARCLGVPIEGPHQDDRFWIDSLPMQRRYFDFPEVGVRAELMSLVGPSTRGCLLGDLFVPVLKRHVEEKRDIGGVG